MATKALNLLKKSKRTSERAKSYMETLGRNMKRNHIEGLEDQIRGLQEKVFDLETFNLNTNVNSGKVAMTREQVESNFNLIFNLQQEIKILEETLALNVEIYNEYFSTEVDEVAAEDED